MIINLAIGLVAGAIIGFLFKKAFKIALLLILVVIVLQIVAFGSALNDEKILNTGNIIKIGKQGFEKAYEEGKKLIEENKNFISKIEAFIEKLKEEISLHIPFFIAFVIGFFAGIMKK